MKKNDFRLGMAKLMAYYDKFQFPTIPEDDNQQLKFDVWYEALSIIDDFSVVIEYYCKTEDYPPQSPRSLLKVYEVVQKKRKGIMSSDEAWELVRRQLKYHGLNGYYDTYNNYHNEFYDNLPPIVKKVCKELHSRLEDLNTDNSSYVAHEFKLIYNRYIEEESKQDTLKIDIDKTLKLGE